MVSILFHFLAPGRKRSFLVPHNTLPSRVSHSTSSYFASYVVMFTLVSCYGSFSVITYALLTPYNLLHTSLCCLPHFSSTQHKFHWSSQSRLTFLGSRSSSLAEVATPPPHHPIPSVLLHDPLFRFSVMWFLLVDMRFLYFQFS